MNVDPALKIGGVDSGFGWVKVLKFLEVQDVTVDFAFKANDTN